MKIKKLGIILVSCLLAFSVAKTQAATVSFRDWRVVVGVNEFVTGNEQLVGSNSLASWGLSAALGQFGYASPLLYEFSTLPNLASPQTVSVSKVELINAGNPCYYIANRMLSCRGPIELTLPGPEGDGILPESGDDGDDQVLDGAAVPLPAAVWLLGSALIGLFGSGRRKA